MSVDTYTQCKIKRHGEEEVAWIPSNYASVGQVIKVKRDGTWDDGWIVTDTFATREREHVEEHERDYTRQRKASDI